MHWSDMPRRNGLGTLCDDMRLRADARRMGVRVVRIPNPNIYLCSKFPDVYRVQKRGWFGIWWTQATYGGETEAIAAAERLVRGEPLHVKPSPVVWP